MKEAWLIEGMSCSSCERAIHKAVSRLKGIRSADVSLADSSLVIDYEPADVTIDEIKSAVGALGYRVTDKKPGENQREHDPVG